MASVGAGPPGTRLEDVARAALPSLGCTPALIGRLVMFPGPALWLPRLTAR